MITQYKDSVKSFINERKAFLLNEIEEMQKELLEVRQEVADAASEGDLRENAAYMAGLERLSQLSNKIAKSEVIIDNLTSVPFVENYVKSKVIGVWSTVHLKSLTNEADDKVFVIVPYKISDIDNNYLSIDAPMSKKLLGKVQGSKVISKNFMTKREIEYLVEEVV